MPREDEREERSSERRHRSKSDRSSNRPHKSRSSRPRPIDPETGEPIRSSHRRRREKDKEKEKDTEAETPAMIDVVPELLRTASGPGASSRTSLPYPSFSKAHSKEAVNSRENVRLSSPKVNIITPEPTDLGSSEHVKSMSKENLAGRNVQRDGRPPSPPDTEFSQDRKATPPRISKMQEEEDQERGSRPSSRTSRRSASLRDDKSKLSMKSKSSKASTAVKMSSSRVSKSRSTERFDEDHDAENRKPVEVEVVSTISSNATATSATPRRISSSKRGKRPPTIETDSSPASAQDSSPQTPTQSHQFTPVVDVKPAPSPFVSFDVHDQQPQAFNSPQPPPPPPPPILPISIPRVDYLMHNGGLQRAIPRTLLAATNPYYPNHFQSRIAIPPAAAVEKVFGPYHSLLDQYETVLSKNGSLAVATGYRSVARRLLERLEAVFARDLPTEGCLCVMCQRRDDYEETDEQTMGWGDVLEWVSGRRELPDWPAFDFAALGLNGYDLTGSGLPSNAANPPRPSSPVKLDPDIAEEFREHYLRQSKKTRVAVDRWLNTCPEVAAAPPQDVDDETLSFAILTHLDRDDRPVYNALIAGSALPIESASRAPTPGTKPRSDFIVKTAQSIQRLYRLPAPPRDPEAAVYLLKNPDIHKLLATLCEINNSEWEILISGRFDGFLWSGAENESSRTTTPMASRGPTPANGIPARQPSVSGGGPGYISRGPTPSSFAGGPSARSTPFQHRPAVSNDEEAEIAVLAEVEREIYQGMEALEDAFEALHRKAETVRRALRERGAGLSVAAQTRMSSQPGFARLDTPGLGIGYERSGGWGPSSDAGAYSESDCTADEAQSELAPDDSASNISSARHRRPKRRNERRTPAPVEEEEDEE